MKYENAQDNINVVPYMLWFPIPIFILISLIQQLNNVSYQHVVFVPPASLGGTNMHIFLAKHMLQLKYKIMKTY